VSAAESFSEAEYLEQVARARARSAKLEGPSVAERFARLCPADRAAVCDALDPLERARLRWHWPTWARPKQQAPDEAHRVLFWLAGRGFGKSTAGANRLRQRIEAGARSVAIIGPTLQEIERNMLGGSGGATGPQGLLDVFPPNQRPAYQAHKGIVRFHTGAIGYVVSAEKPEYRGSNLDTVWLDEPAKCRYLATMWANVELSTRLPGELALEIVLTGTPLPLQLLREIIADEDTVTVIGSTAENESNLDAKFLRKMRRKLEGTRLGRQELGGEILTDNPDALFFSSILDATRVEEHPADLRIVVAVDPAIATNAKNDETGILVVGIDDETGDLYVLADLSGKYKPEQWGALVVQAYEEHGAVAVVCERNRGGDLVASNVRACVERKRGRAAGRAIPIVEVHATRGKALRAEPVSTLHEQGLLHIVGRLPELESEVTEWNPKMGGISPNRLDALVWGVWHLANLGDDDDPAAVDPHAAFVGLGAAQDELAGARTPDAAALGLPRVHDTWGSTL
jgi:phage terminase large subunit-like protein